MVKPISRQSHSLANPLLCGKILHDYNFLDLPEKPSRPQIWLAAQKITLLFASFCKARNLPPQVTAIIFGVDRKCDRHEEAALLGARNLVDAYVGFYEKLEDGE